MRFQSVFAANPVTSGACTIPLSEFDHASQAEVMRREELAAMLRRGEPLSSEARAELQRLSRRARPPIYDTDSPPPGAA